MPQTHNCYECPADRSQAIPPAASVGTSRPPLGATPWKANPTGASASLGTSATDEVSRVCFAVGYRHVRRLVIGVGVEVIIISLFIFEVGQR